MGMRETSAFDSDWPPYISSPLKALPKEVLSRFSRKKPPDVEAVDEGSS